jgi:hypothetical protein
MLSFGSAQDEIFSQNSQKFRFLKSRRAGYSYIIIVFKIMQVLAMKLSGGQILYFLRA